MFHKQKGILPTLVFMFGGFLTGICLLAPIVNGYWRATAGDLQIKENLIRYLAFVLGCLIFAFAGVIIAGLFPDIRITQKGIKFKYFIFFHGYIPWESIEEIIDLDFLGKGIAIVFAQKGFGFNRIYAKLLNFDSSILLIFDRKLKDEIRNRYESIGKPD